MLTKVRFFGSAVALYAVGIGGIILLVENSYFVQPKVHAETQRAVQKPYKPAETRFVLISGKPVRIVLPDSAIDLPVDEGNYNEQTSAWSLSETQAQFAMMTTLANNKSGNTLIYGHGTDAVFGKLGTTHPQQNAQLLIHTDNGHIFSYRFQEVRDITPGDTEILYDTTGPPTVTIQTCTGSFSEWRTLFQFAFEKVVQ